MATYSEEEIEIYTEDDYREMLDESGDIEVCGQTFSPSRILEEMDPTAFSCGFNDFQDYKTVYICDECGEEHDCELDAELCCEDEIADEEDEAYNRASFNAGELI